MAERFIAVDYDPFNEISEKIISTSEEQQEIWTSIQIGGNSASLAYNESITLHLEGACQHELLKHACLQTVERHEALRSAFSNDGLTLRIFDHVNLDIPIIDLSDLSNDEKQKRLKHYIQREVEIPFNLEQGPVIRFAIFKLGSLHTALVITAHHIVCDGWSIGIMMQDISKFYSALVGNTTPDLDEVVPFSAYVNRQQEQKQNGSYAKAEDYWLKLYADDVPSVELPINKPRPGSRTFNASRFDIKIEADTARAIRNLGAKNGSSYVNTLFAAFEVFLYRLTSNNQIVLGLPAAGQSASGMYAMVGHCVNLLPIRSTINEDLTFGAYLKSRKPEMFDAFDHQEFTMGSLLNKLPLQRDPSRIPLVPAVFNVDLGITQGVLFEGLKYHFESNPRKYENFELFINATGIGDELNLECTYNTDLFLPEMMQQRMEEFVVLLKGMVDYPETPVKYLPILTNKEKQQQLIEWCTLKENSLREFCIHHLFETVAATHPEKMALWFDEKEFSYQNINHRANQLAHYLIKMGVKNETLVGICHHRTDDLIVAMLAVLKAGGAYVPLDPNYPPDRIAYILEDAKVPILITSSDLLVHLGSLQSKIVCLDRDNEAISKESNQNCSVHVSPEQLSYIIYTSGSTGKPKGVAIEHHNVNALIFWAQSVYSPSEISGVLASTSICFDLSVFEIFFTLTSGGRIVLVKDALALNHISKKAQVTLINTVPSAIAELLKLKGGIPETVITINLAGEPLPAELVNKIYDNTKANKVYDLYGPSEDTTYSTYTLRVKDGRYTIGKAITNSQVYILDKNLRLLPTGIAGELYMAGDGLARGYLYKPELTNERFLPNPFVPDGRMYKTGDLGRFLPDGNIEFLGRIDNQVKIRGFRIELGEIETAIRQFKDVKELVVVAREDHPGDKRLVAYVAPKQGTQVDVQKLKQHLRVGLPEYMIPSVFMIMEQLPLTPNGKIDRKALPAPEIETIVESASFEEPHNPVESLLVGIWCQVLGLDKIGIHDNFFELGGHSLLGIRMMGEIEQKTGAKLDYPTLFRASTISQLAKVIMSEDLNLEWPIVVPLNEKGNKTPLFLIHMHNGNIQRWRVLLKYFDKDQPVYAIQPRGLDEKYDYHYSIEELADFYIQEIKKIQPQGPYRIAGLCFGGTTAFEIARQLNKKGDKAEKVIMINNYAPPANPMQYKIRETWDEFKGMSFEDKLDFALEKTKNAGKKVLSKITRVFDSSAPEETKVLAKTKPDIRWVHSVALLKYQPDSIYDGDVILIKTGEEVAKHYDDTLGWKRLISGKIEMHKIEGSDNDTIITHKEYYEQLAAIIKQELK
jgi:amino acid adenylation domain-containing protein